MKTIDGITLNLKVYIYLSDQIHIRGGGKLVLGNFPEHVVCILTVNDKIQIDT